MTGMLLVAFGAVFLMSGGVSYRIGQIWRLVIRIRNLAFLLSLAAGVINGPHIIRGLSGSASGLTGTLASMAEKTLKEMGS